MSKLALSASFEYLCYGSTTIINVLFFLMRRPSLYIRICGRQILMYKAGPRAQNSVHQL